MMFDQQEQAEIEPRSKKLTSSFDGSIGATSGCGTGNLTRSGITLNQFWFFAAVAKHLNVTKASEELHVSQPSISQQLRQLENHYGRKLYRRLSKGVEITEAGRLFLRNITPILEQVAKLEGGFKPQAPKSDREILRVGGTYSASAELLPSLLAGFRHRHPAADLEMRTRTSDQLERMLLNSGLDLAVTVREVRSAELACESLRHEKVAMFVRADHRLAKTNKLKPADVLIEPLIVRGGRGASGVVDKALNQIRDEGVEFKVAMYCDGPTEIKAAVRQKMGVGIVFEDALKAEIASGEFKVLKVCGLELEGESFIVYSKKRPLSPLAQEFRELLRCARSTKVSKLDSTTGREVLGNRRSESPLLRTPAVVQQASGLMGMIWSGLLSAF
jgi:LysR family transcriptional regulator, transcriptional activator of the cysJI operon